MQSHSELPPPLLRIGLGVTTAPVLLESAFVVMMLLHSCSLEVVAHSDRPEGADCDLGLIDVSPNGKGDGS